MDLEHVADPTPVRLNVRTNRVSGVQLRMNATLRTANSDILGKGIEKRIDKLLTKIDAARLSAAATATAVSKQRLKRSRPVAPARVGRDNKHIEDVLRWNRVTRGVALNYADLNKQASHWLIQEIGTNRSATIYSFDGKTQVRRIPSQRGRRISSGLVFATGPGGKFTPPGAGKNQQLYLRSKVQGAPVVRRHVRTSDDIGSRRSNSIRIRREIPGQHFVRDGGKAGFRQYRKSVLAAARTQFRREL